MSSLYMKTFILNNIYSNRFLLVAFVKYILSQINSHCIQNCTFRYFLEIVETFIFWGKYFQCLVIFMFLFYPETNNFNNSQIVGHTKLPNPSMTNIFNVLSIDLQYTHHLNFLISARNQAQGYYMNETGVRRIVAHFLNLLVVTEWLLWNRKERQNAVGHALFELFMVSAGVELYLQLRVQ